MLVDDSQPMTTGEQAFHVFRQHRYELARAQGLAPTMYGVVPESTIPPPVEGHAWWQGRSSDGLWLGRHPRYAGGFGLAVDRTLQTGGRNTVPWYQSFHPEPGQWPAVDWNMAHHEREIAHPSGVTVHWPGLGYWGITQQHFPGQFDTRRSWDSDSVGALYPMMCTIS